MTTNDRSIALTIAALRYCQRFGIDLVAAMPDHFEPDENPTTADEIDSVIEALHYPAQQR